MEGISNMEDELKVLVKFDSKVGNGRLSLELVVRERKVNVFVVLEDAICVGMCQILIHFWMVARNF